MRIWFLLAGLLLAPFLANAQDISFSRNFRATNAANVPYTAAVAADWDGNADPGDTDDALNQLAERVDDIEVAGGIGYTPADTNDWPGADPTLVSGALDTLADRVATLETAAAKGRLISVTVNAEAANVIRVDLNIDDLLGSDISGPTRLQVRLYSDANMTTATNAAAFPLTDGGDGNIEATDGGVVAVIVLTGGSSRVQLNCTDSATGSGSTVYGVAEVLAGSSPVVSARARFTVTFDGV